MIDLNEEQRMIIATVRVDISPSNLGSAVEILKSITGNVITATGFLGYRIYRDLEDENILCLVEEWESLADLEKYIDSDEYREMLALMDMSCSPPEISFHKIQYTKGVDIINSVRKKNIKIQI